MPEVTSVTRLLQWPKDVRPEAERDTPRPVVRAAVKTTVTKVEVKDGPDKRPK